jgi:hypothetical protein
VHLVSRGDWPDYLRRGIRADQVVYNSELSCGLNACVRLLESAYTLTHHIAKYYYASTVAWARGDLVEYTNAYMYIRCVSRERPSDPHTSVYTHLATCMSLYTAAVWKLEIVHFLIATSA